MKILHFGKLCPPNEGGIELFSYDLLWYLNSRGVKADLLCFDNFTKMFNYKNFEVFASKMNIKLNSAPISLDFVRTFTKIAQNYDVIHVHSPNPLVEIVKFANTPLDALQVIKYLINNEEYLQVLSRNSEEYAERFSWEYIAMEHIKIYEEIIGGHK